MKRKNNSSIIYAAIVVVILGAIMIFASTATAKTSEARLTLVSPISGKVAVGQPQSVKWTSSADYKPSTVSINLIKKVGDNPSRYELVRVIANSTKNDGKAVWMPSTKDTGSDVSLEIGCVPSQGACKAGDNMGAGLSVIKTGRSTNTASVLEAFEQRENK